MTLDPDDLADPFGEGGMSQLICACTSETFHFVFTDTTVRAICSACKTLNGEWLKSQPAAWEGTTPGGEPIRVVDQDLSGPAQHTWTPGCAGLHPPGACSPLQPRDAARPQVSAGWGDAPVPPPERGPLTDDARKGILPPPALPAFSAGMCNVYLDGGPYDGQITWLMAGSNDFHVSGWATYKATSKTRDGRIVYAFKED